MEKVSWGSGIAGLGPLDFQVSHIFIHIYTPFYLKTSRQVARRRRSTEPPGSVTLFKPGTASATSIAPKKTGAKFQPQLLLLRKKHSDQIHLINPNHKKKVPRELRSKDNYEVVLKKNWTHVKRSKTGKSPGMSVVLSPSCWIEVPLLWQQFTSILSHI